MAQRTSTSLVLIYLFGLIGLVVGLELQRVESVGVENIRVKRQSGARPQIPLEQGRPSASLGVGVQGGAQASASSLSSSLTGDGQLGANMGLASPAVVASRPKRPKAQPALSMAEADAEVSMGSINEDADDDDNEDLRPVRVKPKKKNKKRPKNRRPVASHDEDEEEAEDDYEDCHDGDYGDYGHVFHEAATRPMRHFGRMMDGMFSKMRGLAAGDLDGFPGGANSALATSSSNSDGYSRVSSVVNNNGRSRGIVSETRNGRTKTRRIGSDDDDDEE